MRTPRETVEEFIATFIVAWPTRDADRVASCFSEDAVYHNMPLDPVRGRPAIRDTVAGFMAMGGRVAVEVVHVVADGPVVMVERVDHFVGDDQSVSLPMVGVFEVHDDQIVAWRDYFDLSQLQSTTPAERRAP